MSESQNNSVLIEKFVKYLDENGKRRTPERFKILELVLAFNKNFSIEDLSHSVESQNFFVSKSTLYNTVDLFVQSGILRRVNIENGSCHYERVENVNYIHLKCEVCGKLKFVKDLNFMAYMNARKFVAFTTSYYNLMVYGICNDCARKLKRRSRKSAADKSKRK